MIGWEIGKTEELGGEQLGEVIGWLIGEVGYTYFWDDEG